MEEMICEAIRSRMTLRFNYRGGGCTVEPHCLGKNDKGGLVLLGYQLSGQALTGASGQGVGWVPFPVDKLSDLKPTEIPFTERPVPTLRETIVEVICRADWM
jgi:hypothetical protein